MPGKKRRTIKSRKEEIRAPRKKKNRFNPLQAELDKPLSKSLKEGLAVGATLAGPGKLLKPAKKLKKLLKSPAKKANKKDAKRSMFPAQKAPSKEGLKGLERKGRVKSVPAGPGRRKFVELKPKKIKIAKDKKLTGKALENKKIGDEQVRRFNKADKKAAAGRPKVKRTEEQRRKARAVSARPRFE